MKPQNMRIKRKMNLLRKIFPTQCLCNSAFIKQFAHIKPTSLNGRGRGKNKRFWDIINNYFCYAVLCESCHERFDKGKSIMIMTEKGIRFINYYYPFY